MLAGAEVVTIVANFRFCHQTLNFKKKIAKYLALLFFVSYFKETPLIKFLYLLFVGNVLVKEGLEAGVAAVAAVAAAEGGSRNCSEPLRAR